MTALQSIETLHAFHSFAGALQAAAPVCPKIPLPSAWAAEKLKFHAEGKQKEVLDKDAHRLILCCSRQWGKTTVIAIKALHTAVFQPGSEILVLSRSERQAGILVRKVRAMAAVLGYPRKKVQGFDFSLELPNGSSIFAVAHSETTGGRGSTASIVIVDEAAMAGDDVIGAATPTLSRTRGKLWLLSTPHGQSGLFYNVWHDPQLTGWIRVKATIEDTPYAGAAFIEEQKRLFPFNFRQDFYCEFTPPKGRLLSRERVERMIDPTIQHIPFPRLGDGLK